MRIIYRHMNSFPDRKYESPRMTGTVALKVPTYLKTMLTSQFRTGKLEPIVIPFGISLCHKHDQFNKKVGRELAESRIKDVAFQLNTIDLSNSEFIEYNLTTTIGDAKISLRFKEYRDSLNIRLVEADSFSQSLWDSY